MVFEAGWVEDVVISWSYDRRELIDSTFMLSPLVQCQTKFDGFENYVCH